MASTITRSRASSVDSKNGGGPTFVNFSTRNRTLSMSSETSVRLREQIEGNSRPGTATSTKSRDDDAAEEVLPYR